MQEIPISIKMFTDEEKTLIFKEFTFNDCRRLNWNFETKQGREFTEQDLETVQNELIRNHSTKSVILAPFNSSASDINAKIPSYIKKLIVSKDKIKFGPRVREVNRKYEENNNQEVDNGVYNQFEDSDSDKASKEEEIDKAVQN